MCQLTGKGQRYAEKIKEEIEVNLKCILGFSLSKQWIQSTSRSTLAGSCGTPEKTSHALSSFAIAASQSSEAKSLQRL